MSTLQQQLQDAVAAHRQGGLDKAEAGYRAVLRADPKQFDATHLLGVVLYSRGRHQEAETLLRRALALKPNVAAAQNNLGNVVNALGRKEEALAFYGRAIALDPDYADACNNRGNVFDELGRRVEALADFDRVLALNPGNLNALQRSARLLAEAGRSEEALVRNDRAMALNANSSEAWMRSGNVLVNLKRPLQALESYDRALALDPKNTLCAVNRSAALGELGRYEEALAGLDAALAHNPDDIGALNNKATILKSLGRIDEALVLYRKGVALRPDHADTQSNYGLASLLTGDFETGWRGFEHRWAKKENAGKRPVLPFAEWNGEALRGKRILVYAEQGHGDIVQFGRYLPLLRAQGAEVGFLVAARLHAVLARAFPGIALFEGAEQVRGLPFEVCCAMMSLPLHFGTRVDSVPARVPYLKADPANVARWRERIGGGGFKIGIAWQGNPFVSVDFGRSIPLEEFAPLAALAGVRLISLQKNEGVEQLARLPAVETLGEDFDAGSGAFLDTMAVMESLDLVISSDTAVAHFAGALARPVWVALKDIPDWRWMLDRPDSPWYPTMALFRQKRPGDWADVFARMRDALRPLVPPAPDESAR